MGPSHTLMKRQRIGVVLLSVVLSFSLAALFYREHQITMDTARSFTRSHLQAIGAGEVEAAIRHYGEEVLVGPKRSPDTWRQNLGRLRGLRRCEEYLCVATL